MPADYLDPPIAGRVDLVEHRDDGSVACIASVEIDKDGKRRFIDDTASIEDKTVAAKIEGKRVVDPGAIEALGVLPP